MRSEEEKTERQFIIMNSDYEKVTAIVSKYEGNRDSLISILQDIQSEYRYLPENALKSVARQFFSRHSA